MLSCLERDGGVSSVRFKPRRTHLARHQSQTVQHCPRGTMPWCEVCGGEGVGREGRRRPRSRRRLCSSRRRLPGQERHEAHTSTPTTSSASQRTAMTESFASLSSHFPLTSPIPTAVSVPGLLRAEHLATEHDLSRNPDQAVRRPSRAQDELRLMTCISSRRHAGRSTFAPSRTSARRTSSPLEGRRVRSRRACWARSSRRPLDDSTCRG
jgi:hypothetical protein